MMMHELKNPLLIGLTVLALAFGAYQLDPQPSTAQQYVDQQAPATPDTPDDPDHVEETDPVPPGQKPTIKPTVTQRPRQPSIHNLIGIHDARARLGKDVPTGEGITVGHVEFGPGAYMPNTKQPQFDTVAFVERSGKSRPSGHASATARVIYGLNGLAPGVSVVHCYDSRDWMGPGYLNAGSPQPPAGGPMRVITHSWVSDSHNAVDVLRRVDWLIDANDTIMCVGVNNGKHTPVPYMLATSYNAIAVGTNRAKRVNAPKPDDPAAVGGSSGGYTRIEVRDRCKPDIVGPRQLTSFTTPAVAAVATRLLQAAEEAPENAHLAAKAETIKAVLLAGATKTDDWQPEPGKPLDEFLGAGVVNFNSSLMILQAGPPGSAPAPGSSTGSNPGSEPTGDGESLIRLPNRMGWDYGSIEPDGKNTYTFALQSPMAEASIILTWHRRITGIKTDDTDKGEGNWFGMPRLANLDLKLVHTDETGEQHELAVSSSKVDNVEHIYLKELQPGRYHLHVSRPESIHEEPWDYALAWRVELIEDEASAEEE